MILTAPSSALQPLMPTSPPASVPTGEDDRRPTHPEDQSPSAGSREPIPDHDLRRCRGLARADIPTTELTAPFSVRRSSPRIIRPPIFHTDVSCRHGCRRGRRCRALSERTHDDHRPTVLPRASSALQSPTPTSPAGMGAGGGGQQPAISFRRPVSVCYHPKTISVS